MPKSRVRLSAGRKDMSDEMQALCFFAGANSIFYGDKLLTTDNPMTDHDQELFQRLGVYMRRFKLRLMRRDFYAFDAELAQLKQQSLYRSRCVIDGPQAVFLQVDDRQLINFCSNDYLGLANHPQCM